MTESKELIYKASYISLVTSIVVLAIKFYAYFQTSSAAILSDAMETIVNVMTAIVAIVVLKYALAPADDDHPYGHGKLEYFSAAFEGGIILFAALAIIYESIKSFIHKDEIKNLEAGLLYIILGAALNAIVGLYIKKTGIRHNSETLKASGSHLIADVKTTVGIVVGLLLYKITGWVWIDPLLGVLVGIWLVYESAQIIRDNIGGLLDSTDLSSIVELSEKIDKHITPNIIDIHNLRIIRSGSFHHIDAHLVVPQFYEISHVHELLHEFEKQVVLDYKFDGEFAFHTDPCYQKYCSVCRVESCPIRLAPFVSRPQMTPEHLVAGPMHTN